MSLKVWLPLNGDLENFGTTDFTYTTSTVGGYEAGKIGQALSLLNSKLVFNIPSLNGATKFSMAFWYKPRTNSNLTANWYNIIALTAKSADETVSAQWRCESSYGNSYVISHHNNQGSPIDAGHGSLVTVRDQWYHICLTCDGITSTKAYVNGTLKSTLPYQGGHLTGLIGIADEASKPDGLLNDVRIYDHALSAAEVKEISQGLILHYKLDGIRQNYILNSSGIFLSNLGSAEGSRAEYRAKSLGQNLPIESGTTITISFDLYMEFNTATAYLYVYNTNNKGPHQTINGINALAGRTVQVGDIINERISVTGVITDRAEPTQNVDYIEFYSTYGSNNWFSISNIKLEVGNSSTAYIPAEVELPNIIQDSSGYHHNGTITGNITIESSSSRYLTHTNFIDSACAINIGNLSTLVPDGIFTFNIWFKKITNEWSSKSWETILGGPSGFELEGKLSSTTNAYIHPYSWGGGSTTTPNSYSIEYSLDEWHMLTMVRSTSNAKFYLDGELKVTGSAGSIPSGDYFIGAWQTNAKQNYRGHLSDARIYCTPLLDSDIKMLYNTSMSIDDLNNVHSFEFESSQNNEITKTGISKNDIIEPYITLKDGSYWKLLLFHYVDHGNNLFTSSNATYCNDFGLYSRLREINNYTYDGKYEYYVNQDGKEFRWTQTSSPTASSISGLTVVNGYTDPVNGLAKPSNLTQTYIGYNAWWGACGCWTAYSTGGKTGIPGFGPHNGDGICEQYLALYVRIEKDKVFLEKSFINASNFIEK